MGSVVAAASGCVARSGPAPRTGARTSAPLLLATSAPDLPTDASGAADRDHDGLPDVFDDCADAADDSGRSDGCPDVDGDGLPDAEDACPRRPGPAADGCPEVPTRRPAVAKRRARAESPGEAAKRGREPARAETEPEPASASLPVTPPGPPALEVRAGPVVDRLFFGHSADRLPESTEELDALAGMVEGMDEPIAVVVIGFADEAEPAPEDLALRRAQGVREALVARGVAPARIAIAIGRSSSSGPPGQDQRAEIRLRAP